MYRIKLVIVLLLCFIVSGCVHVEYIDGPSIGTATEVAQISVEVVAKDAAVRIISEPKDIDKVLWLFSEKSWEMNTGHSLSPAYMINLQNKAGESSIYWLGAYAELGLFPCYSFCSGWWLAASNKNGEIDESKYKNLASSHAMFLVASLIH